jgi:hypothetical protein
MTNPSRLRKKLLEAAAMTNAGTDDEIDIVGCATIAYTSENPAAAINRRTRRVPFRSQFKSCGSVPSFP